jgi:hypothetical protein
MLPAVEKKAGQCVRLILTRPPGRRSQSTEPGRIMLDLCDDYQTHAQQSWLFGNDRGWIAGFAGI